MDILHVFKDEKVVNSFIALFESVFPNKSHYLIVKKWDNVRYVKSGANTFFFDNNSSELLSFLNNSITDYTHVCLHSIGGDKFYQNINHPSISWVIWGADLYEGILAFKGYQIYDLHSEQLKIRAQKVPIFIYRFYTWLRDYRRYIFEKRILKKIKYIITDNGCDYDVFRKYIPELSIMHLGSINYYPIENLIGVDNMTKWCEGNAIWVGNSPAPNGNHVSVLERLVNFNNKIKVYCPISYGDARLIKYIDTKGQELLGNRFHPLKNFIPSEEYYSLFLQANCFIFGHYRQCAVGNILMALYFGGKVFLYNKNPLLKMYRDLGFFIYSIDEELSEETALTQLPIKQRNHNRNLVMNIASEEESLKQMVQVFAPFVGHLHC